MAVTSELVPQAALSAAADGAVVATLPGTVVRAYGPDAAPFLHGQLANDVTGLSVGSVNQSLALNHKGHAMAQCSVLRRAKDEALLVVDDAGAPWLVDSLESHIIFDQVTLEQLPELRLLTLQGAAAAGLLPAAPPPGGFVEVEVAGAQVVAYQRRRSALGGFDLLVGQASVPAVLAALVAAGAVEVGVEVVDALRVRGMVPTAAGEGGDGVLPQEAGLESALSYRKGCYLGQEIMARIEARGNLRRSLARLELQGEVGAERQIRLEGRVVGRLGSVVMLENPAGGEPLTEALAVLRNDLPEGAQLQVGDAAVCRAYNRA